MRLIPRNDDLGWTPYAWTVYVAFFAISPMFSRHATALDWVTAIGGTILFLGLYFRGYWVRGRDIIPIITAVLLLGLVLYPHNTAAGAFFIYAAAFASRLDHDRAAIATIAGIELLVAIEAFVTPKPLFAVVWVVVFAIALATGMKIGGNGVDLAGLHHDEPVARHVAQDRRLELDVGERLSSPGYGQFGFS